MIGVGSGLLILGGVVLAILSANYEGDVFRRMATFVFELLQKVGVRFQGENKVKRTLEGLYSVRVDEKQYKDFYVEKLRLILMVVLVGAIFSLLIWAKSVVGSRELQEISRPDAGGGTKELQLEVKKGREKAIVSLEVEERLLEETEVAILAERCMETMGELLKTPSYAGVTDVSELPEAMEGYPFEILWRRTGEGSLTGYF